MKTYIVSFTQQTKSRCGTYNYNQKDVIKAENEEQAKAICMENNKAPSGRRWKIIIRDVFVIAD